MSDYRQVPKEKIDVGIQGDANTGDIIYDGGVKLNSNMDALYNSFGDARLYDLNDGDGLQLLHATGYYQKFPRLYYSKGGIESGSRHDLNTTTGSFGVTLPTPKLGEMVEFINSNGSFAINPITIQAQAGGDIEGEQLVIINHGFVKLTFVCTDDTPNSAKWQYKIEPMFGDFSVPINTTFDIDNATAFPIALCKKEMYEGIKLMVSAYEVIHGTKERTVSEILLLIDADDNTVLSDEYSVIFKNEKIFTIDFIVNNGIVQANVVTTKPHIKFSIKTIETIKASIS
jgi:hypothetical protein